MKAVKKNKFDAIVLSSNDEKTALDGLALSLKETPIPADELLANLGLFLTSKNLARLLFFYELYKKIRYTHGSIVEFGVRWGQTLSLMSALRGMFEPFNRHRPIIGFDTFTGFAGVSKKDGRECHSKDGSFSVSTRYEDYLEGILRAQEALNPLAHLKKFELIKGNAVKTVPQYFKNHPETIISLAIFDFDLYAPTKAALTVIKSRLHKGSILVFDELNDNIFPGETVAFREVFNINQMKIKRSPRAARLSYIEIE